MTNVSGTSSPSAPNILQRRPTYSHLNKMSEMPSLPPPSSDPPIVRKRPSAIEKRPNTFELDCHRSISSFALLEVVGEGTYGEVRLISLLKELLVNWNIFLGLERLGYNHQRNGGSEETANDIRNRRFPDLGDSRTQVSSSVATPKYHSFARYCAGKQEGTGF